jgi:hypothetical protein
MKTIRQEICSQTQGDPDGRVPKSIDVGEQELTSLLYVQNVRDENRLNARLSLSPEPTVTSKAKPISPSFRLPTGQGK